MLRKAREQQDQERELEDQKNQVQRSEAQVKERAEEVLQRQKELELQFEVKEVINDIVARVEERSLAEDKSIKDGLDEEKVQELMRQMQEVERQKDELDKQRLAVSKAAFDGGSGGPPPPPGGGGGEDGGYIDWLKKQMMRSNPGQDEDELNWQFAVDNKQVGSQHTFLHLFLISFHLPLFLSPLHLPLATLFLCSLSASFFFPFLDLPRHHRSTGAQRFFARRSRRAGCAKGVRCHLVGG